MSDNLFTTMSALIEQGIDPVEQENQIWDKFGRTRAVLILDSSGFSRVTESHGMVHFLAKLMQMRATTMVVFEKYACQEPHFEADNVLGFFEDTDAAVNCALDIHQAIHAAGIMLTATEPFTVCIGVGYGEMLYSETLEGYFAKELNFASKLGEDIAAAGETLITESAHEQLSKENQAKFISHDAEISGLKLHYYKSTQDIC